MLTIHLMCTFSSAHASPKFEGRGGEELSSELSRILDRACSNRSALDLKSLSITSGQQCWVLYVDALVSHKISVLLHSQSKYLWAD